MLADIPRIPGGCGAQDRPFGRWCRALRVSVDRAACSGPQTRGKPWLVDLVSSGCVDEREHFFCYTRIITDIGPFGEPASKISSLGILCRHDADGELGGSSGAG